MFKSKLLKPFLLTAAIAASLGAGVANSMPHPNLPKQDIPVTAHAPGGAPADSITVNTRLTKDKIWILNGYTMVKKGVTLTIDPGTWIEPSPAGKATLMVDRGAWLIAAGTKAEPITFQMADVDGVPVQRGLWGGVVLLGKGITNQGAFLAYEGLGWSKYGGTDNNDSSGVLTYVRLDGPGFPVEVDRELNGFTFCTVGSKTVLSHLQVHRGDDDGMEWFGGAANADHLVVTQQTDDSFDTDHGYSGTIDYMIGIQRRDPPILRTPGGSVQLEPVGDFGIECGSSASKLEPFTRPLWSHITLIDNGGVDGAIDFKEECAGTYEKMVVVAGGATLDSASGWAFRVKDQGTASNITAPTNPPLDLKEVFLTGNWKLLYDLSGITTQASKDLTAAVLDAKIKKYPYATTKSFGLYKDLTPSNPDILAAKAGAIVDGDLWYEGWTLPNTMEFELGDVPNAGAPVPELTRSAGELSAPANFTLNATATDADGIATLEILEGATVLASGTTGNLSFDVINATSGTHTYTVRAKDKHAFKVLTSTKNLVVEVSNPVPVVTLVRAGTDGLAAPATISLNATATDLDGIATLEILEGATVLATATTGTLNFNVPNVTSGTHTYTVRATDKNPIAASASKTLSLIVTNPHPVVSITRTGAAELFAPATFTLKTTASDLDGIAKLEILEGTTVLASNTDTTLGFTVSNLDVGNHTYIVRATDKNVGDPQTHESLLLVVVKVAPPNIAPKVAFTPLSENLFAPATFTLSAKASDTDGAITSLEIFDGATKLGGSNTGELSVTIPAKAAGSYKYTVKATDNHPTNPLTSSDSITVTVYNPPAANNEAAPVVGLQLVTSVALVAPASFSLLATASDANGIDTLQVLLENTVVATGTSLSLLVPLTGKPAGTYWFKVRAKDKHATDPKTTLDSVKVVVEAPAPNTAPTLSLTRSGSETLYGPASFSLIAFASDDHGIDTLRIFKDDVLFATKVGSDTSLQISGLAAGTYKFKAVAKDKHPTDPKVTSKELIVVVLETPTVKIGVPLRDLNGIQIYASQGQNLVIQSAGYGNIKIGIWTMGGRYIGTRNVKINQGKNSIDMGNLRGVHIVRISNGKMSRSARVVFSTGN